MPVTIPAPADGLSLEALRAKAAALLETTTDAATLWAVAVTLEKATVSRAQQEAAPESYTAAQRASIARGLQQLTDGHRTPAAEVMAQFWAQPE